MQGIKQNNASPSITNIQYTIFVLCFKKKTCIESGCLRAGILNVFYIVGHIQPILILSWMD